LSSFCSKSSVLNDSKRQEPTFTTSINNNRYNIQKDDYGKEECTESISSLDLTSTVVNEEQQPIHNVSVQSLDVPQALCTSSTTDARRVSLRTRPVRLESNHRRMLNKIVEDLHKMISRVRRRSLLPPLPDTDSDAEQPSRNSSFSEDSKLICVACKKREATGAKNVFGVPACLGCVNFFLQSFSRKYYKQRCLLGKNACNVTMIKCHSCRLMQCLSAGMQPLTVKHYKRAVEFMQIVSEFNDGKCQVCKLVSHNGYRCGARVCISCAAFYRRLCVKDSNYIRRLRCVGGRNRCDLAKQKRNMCRRCRMWKCLELGMQPTR
jgi:hypothetical protein